MSGCRRVHASTIKAGDVQTWDEPAIITHGASLRHFDWSRRRLLREFGSFNLSQRDLSFNGAGSWFLAHRAAAPIKAGGRKFERYAGFNVTLREVISVDQPGNLFLPGAGLTVPAHNHIWPRLIPRKSQLPPPLRRVLQGLGRWRHASMGSARQWNPVHNHQVAVFTQLAGRKGWALAPWQQREAYGNRAFFGSTDVETRDDFCGLFGGAAGAAAAPGARLCVVEEGESIVVPGNKDGFAARGWWHGTCGLGEWNAGFTFIGYSSED